jgi:hypothetical protein
MQTVLMQGAIAENEIECQCNGVNHPTPPGTLPSA